MDLFMQDKPKIPSEIITCQALERIKDSYWRFEDFPVYLSIMNTDEAAKVWQSLYAPMTTCTVKIFSVPCAFVFHKSFALYRNIQVSQQKKNIWDILWTHKISYRQMQCKGRAYMIRLGFLECTALSHKGHVRKSGGICPSLVPIFSFKGVSNGTITHFNIPKQ